MKRSRVLVPALVLAVLALLPSAARAQEDGYPFRLANFSFELIGGLAKVNPTDFNELASGEEQYLQYYYVTRFNYYHNLYGTGYPVNIARTGDSRFLSLTRAAMAGIRLRYDLSPSLGLSVALQVLDAAQPSRVGMTVGVPSPVGVPWPTRDYIDYAGPLTYSYQNSGFLLATRAWFPQIGAHFGWQFGPVFRFEAHVAGGPFYVNCQATTERRMSTADGSGYATSSLYALDMKGSSTGFAGELGARLSAKTAGFLDLFVEAAFAFRDAAELKGSSLERTVAYDSNAAQDPVVSTWNGTWEGARTTTTAAWGTLIIIAPQNKLGINQFTGMGMRKFTLNLSGFQLKAGLAIHFGRPARAAD